MMTDSHTYTVQMLILHPFSNEVDEKFCKLCKLFLGSLRTSKTGKDVVFDGAHANLRPTPQGLEVKIKASDVLLFYGILTLLKSCISFRAK